MIVDDDDNTQINWKEHGYAMLRDNLANPYINADEHREAYLSQLIGLVAGKCRDEILPDNKRLSDWILDILQEIGSTAPPDSNDDKALKKAQKRAVFFMQQIVPHLSTEALLGLHELIATKHNEDDNPYGFIRRERHGFRMKYGNTKPWETIITLIKEQLTPHKSELQEGQHKLAADIMRTQTIHKWQTRRVL